MIDRDHLVSAETREQSGVTRDASVESHCDNGAAESRRKFVAA